MTVPVLLLPGLLCDQRLFERLQLPTEWQVRSSMLPQHDSFEAMAAELLNTAPPRFVLGGLSMGGLLAWEVYRQAADRVLGLWICSSNFAAEMPEVSAARDQLVRRAQNGEFLQLTAEVLLPKMVHQRHLVDSYLCHLVVQMAESVGLERFVAHAKALKLRADASQVLTSVAVPTLLTCGREDLLCPVDRHLRMAAAIRECSLHILSPCGHLATLERAQELSLHIKHWWECCRSTVEQRLTASD